MSMKRVNLAVRMDGRLFEAYSRLGETVGEPASVIVRSLIRQYCVDVGLLESVPEPGVRRPDWGWGAHSRARGIGAQNGVQRVQGAGGRGDQHE